MVQIKTRWRNEARGMINALTYQQSSTDRRTPRIFAEGDDNVDEVLINTEREPDETEE